jgi:hypothetical protein
LFGLELLPEALAVGSTSQHGQIGAFGHDFRPRTLGLISLQDDALLKVRQRSACLLSIAVNVQNMNMQQGAYTSHFRFGQMAAIHLTPDGCHIPPEFGENLSLSFVNGGISNTLNCRDWAA